MISLKLHGYNQQFWIVNSHPSFTHVLGGATFTMEQPNSQSGHEKKKDKKEDISNNKKNKFFIKQEK